MSSKFISSFRKYSVAGLVGLLVATAGCSDSDSDNTSGTEIDYRTQAEMIQLISDLGGIRADIYNYHTFNGNFPENLQDLDIDPKRATTASVKSVRVNQGQIIADSNTFDGWVSLTPTSAMGGSKLEWSCATNIKGMNNPPLSCKYSEKPPAHP